MIQGGDDFIGGDLSVGNQNIGLDTEEDNECGKDKTGDALVKMYFG